MRRFYFWMGWKFIKNLSKVHLIAFGKIIITNLAYKSYINMRINSITDNFHFGKYKDKKISQIIIENPNYISWCIRYLDNFYIYESFIKDAIMLNSNFNIGISTIEILDRKIQDTNEYNKSFVIFDIKLDNLHETETVKILQKYSYKDWLNPLLQPMLIDLETKKRLEDEQIKIELEEIREQYKREEEERRYRNETDWSSHNDDLGWGEQSEKFWNQF
ncbi:hypothetical protein HHL23_12065 [Chryseobacterium sp. RP-3-3]|uniref:Exodeoxyribonuclease X-like C-terminal domain-containing protein n=1 Tax=Chryseobacterium antibioticum TaxID=2728847 RepID=A0A7Y0ANK2_9FLAO|nr:hypothetical protein [Chryseobacterium antibioticum]NML70534.1 hypothetical protein [Chryseobacterium antibioticum]